MNNKTFGEMKIVNYDPNYYNSLFVLSIDTEEQKNILNNIFKNACIKQKTPLKIIYSENVVLKLLLPYVRKVKTKEFNDADYVKISKKGVHTNDLKDIFEK